MHAIRPFTPSRRPNCTNRKSFRAAKVRQPSGASPSADMRCDVKPHCRKQDSEPWRRSASCAEIEHAAIAVRHDGPVGAVLLREREVTSAGDLGLNFGVIGRTAPAAAATRTYLFQPIEILNSRPRVAAQLQFRVFQPSADVALAHRPPVTKLVPASTSVT
jgi:hypothetical protein